LELQTVEVLPWNLNFVVATAAAKELVQAVSTPALKELLAIEMELEEGPRPLLVAK
jgi:hypothetical protein